MESVFIYPEVIGQRESGLVIDDDGFRWSARKPRGSWSLRGKLPDTIDTLSLDELIRLEQPGFNLSPPQKFINSILGLPTTVSPPWGQLMSGRDYLLYLKRLAGDIINLFDTVDTSFYLNTWSEHTKYFSSLRRFSSPHKQLFLEEIPESDSFKPRGDWCDKITYNRFGTRTGRLTITAGPRILTLKRDARKLLTSRWGDNGCLLSFDFSALEVRLMMADSTGVVPPNDPYMDLSGVVGNLDREHSKLALISTVYGATEHGLSGSLHTTIGEARRIKEIISSRYGTTSIIDKLRSQFMSLGYVRNRYGRRVEVTDPGDGSLLNSYLQSTGVDASLWGFKEIIDRLPEEHAVPVAFLHDALIVDCTMQFVEKIGESISVPVKGFTGKFPMKISVFNR